jgi:Protein of unknown function (DUF4058)
MPTPFPGMNPYLEQPEFWSDFHNQLVTALARSLVPLLIPKYRVVTDKWIYKVNDASTIAIGRPDVAVQQSRIDRTIAASSAASAALAQPIQVMVPLSEEVQQPYLQVRDTATQAVITTIEVLSPANKRGEGRRKYELKRQQILESLTHLVEIDLLRDGEPLPLANQLMQAMQSHYRILVSRSQTRPTADLYPFNLNDPIPLFPLPLRSEDPEVVVDLRTIITDLYEQLGYDYFIDYRTPPPPPWVAADVAPFINLNRNRPDRLTDEL